MTNEEQPSVEKLMALVSEYGQCRWSEGSSGATHLDRMGEKRSREEAADLYAQIERMAAHLQQRPLTGRERDETKRPSMSMFATADDYNAAMDEWLGSGTAPSLPVREEPTPLTIDQQYWLDRRAEIIEALDAEGLHILSDRERVWLHRVAASPSTDKEGAAGVGGTDGR